MIYTESFNSILWPRYPCFDAISHKSYINSCIFSGAYIKDWVSPWPSNCEQMTGDKMYLVITFSVHSSANLLWWSVCWCHKAIQEHRVTSQYYTHHKHTHYMMWIVHVQCTVNVYYMYLMYCYVMARHTHAWWAYINYKTGRVLWDGMWPQSQQSS